MTSYESAVTIPTDATQVQLRFTHVPVGTAGTNDWFEIEELFLIVGAVKPTLEVLSYAEAFIRAEAEYRKSYNYDTVAGSVATAGALEVSGIGTTTIAEEIFNVALARPMRVTPTITLYNPSTGNSGSMRNLTDSTNINVTAANIGTNGFVIEPSSIGESLKYSTFVPAISSVTVTETAVVGKYTEVGDICFFDVDITYNTLDTADSSDINIVLTGAPAAATNGVGAVNVNIQASTGFTFGISDTFIPTLFTSSLTIAMTDGTGANWDYNDSKMAASGRVVFAGFYRTAKTSGRKLYSVHYVAEARL
jgi:hypothetical protein